MRTVAIYTRVSTVGQSCLAQETELRQIAARAGWRIVEVYSDHGISGAKSRKDRPAFDRLLRDASRRRFDQIACWTPACFAARAMAAASAVSFSGERCSK